jgi:molybdopterin/thiamine biosynthesis adenylyltransferase
MSSRYSSQIAVEEIGIGGQELFKKSKVLIIGAGGLGTPVATYLAAAGVGNVVIIDGDKISQSNLHRQWMYNANEIGKYKSEVLSAKLSIINHEININSHTTFVDENNINSFISEVDIVCDCTDNVSTRILIDETCFLLKKPLVYAAVSDWIGYLTILNGSNKIRLKDIFSAQKLNDEKNNSCSVTGIIGTTCGVLGALQASEVIKLIIGQSITLNGSLLCYDTLTNSQRIFKLKKSQTS